MEKQDQLTKEWYDPPTAEIISVPLALSLLSSLSVESSFEEWEEGEELEPLP